MNNNYELKIISKDQTSEGKVLKKYVIDGQEIVGVVEGEPFEIEFKNKTWNKIQFKLSIDGTDISTGELASTSSEGTMWYCEPYGTVKLKAWPENSKGGAEFMFSKVEDSVAANTHENMSGKGIIAAAIFIEGYVSPLTYDYNRYGAASGSTYGYGGLLTKSTINTNCLRGAKTDLNSTVMKHSVISNNTAIPQNSYIDQSSDNLAVGAGNYVNQEIVKVAGLREPKLDTTVSVKYESWNSLRSKVRALQKAASNPTNPAFPGDSELKMIDLKKTPRGRKKPSRNPDLQRF